MTAWKGNRAFRNLNTPFLLTDTALSMPESFHPRMAVSRWRHLAGSCTLSRNEIAKRALCAIPF